jgi:hypothetical protein
MRKWTLEERAAQAALTRAQKPWEKSTSPKTKAGKEASSRNALTHGLTTAQGLAFTAALRDTRHLIRLLKKMEDAS